VTTASGTTFTLSRLEFDVIWEYLQLGPFPTVYRMLGHGETHDQRKRLVKEAWQSLQHNGFATSELNPELVGMLRTLARPQQALDLRMGHRGKEVRALAGSRHEHAARGVLDGDLVLSEITPGGLSRTMVALLPQHPAGKGHSVTLSSRAFNEACMESSDTSGGLRAALLLRGMRSDDAAQLAEALDRPFGGGQFGAAVLDRWGKRHRADHVVGFVDTASGRYLLESRAALGGGEQWTTIAPTDAAKLTAQVDRLLAELRQRLST
jgi:EspG family